VSDRDDLTPAQCDARPKGAGGLESADIGRLTPAHARPPTEGTAFGRAWPEAAPPPPRSTPSLED